MAGADPDPRGVRAAYAHAAEHLVALVGRIDPATLERPGTGDWSLRVLVAHAGGAFLSLERVLATEVDLAAPRLAGPADYFRAAMDTPGVHAGIDERAHERARALGDAPAEVLARDAARVEPVLAARSLSGDVQPFSARLSLGDYLVTRVCELVLHAADVALAIGEVPAAPRDAALLVRDVMVDLVDRAEPLAVACALAGRRLVLPCNVLA